MSGLERLDGALEWYEANGERLMDWPPVLEAARAYRDLLANGQRVWWCEIHDAQQDREDRIRCDWADGRGCRIVSKLLSVYPKEAENG